MNYVTSLTRPIVKLFLTLFEKITTEKEVLSSYATDLDREFKNCMGKNTKCPGYSLCRAGLKKGSCQELIGEMSLSQTRKVLTLESLRKNLFSDTTKKFISERCKKCSFSSSCQAGLRTVDCKKFRERSDVKKLSPETQVRLAQLRTEIREKRERGSGKEPKTEKDKEKGWTEQEVRREINDLIKNSAAAVKNEVLPTPAPQPPQQ